MVDTLQAGLGVVMSNCCEDGPGIAGLQPASAAPKMSELQKAVLKHEQSTAVYNCSKIVARRPSDKPDNNAVTVKWLKRALR